MHQNLKRLLARYTERPTPANRTKLQVYVRNHPVTVALTTPEQAEFLRQHNLLRQDK